MTSFISLPFSYCDTTTQAFIPFLEHSIPVSSELLHLLLSLPKSPPTVSAWLVPSCHSCLHLNVTSSGSLSLIAYYKLLLLHYYDHIMCLFSLLSGISWMFLKFLRSFIISSLPQFPWNKNSKGAKLRSLSISSKGARSFGLEEDLPIINDI